MRTLLTILILCNSSLYGWGLRGHQAINRVAVMTIPDNGPVFLKQHEDWIVHLAIIPDTWRIPAEPTLKIIEDPNHGWFKEQFSELKEIPRSRYEFVIALYELQKKQAVKDPERARLTNIRWTGTLPYAAQEEYERMKAAMRRYRAMKSGGQDTTFVEREISASMGRLGHYTGDGAQPLHDTIHHDGWAGENPRDFTREPRIHGRFESQYVEMIEVKPEDFIKLVKSPKKLDDPFAAILNHLNEAFSHVEEVYELDKSGALADKDNEKARMLVYERLAAGSQLLRDLTYTAWVESEQPFRFNRQGGNPIDPKGALYNPATGSAPSGPPVPEKQ